MAEKWVEKTVAGFEKWAGERGGTDLHGARIIVSLLDLNETGELTVELLEETLLEDFPENVLAGPDDAPAVLSAARALVEYLARGELDAAVAQGCRELLDGIGPRLTEALAQSGGDEGDAMEFLGRMMAAEGIDLDDEAAVSAWIAEFESLSEEEQMARGMRHFASENVVPPVKLAPVPELAAAARESNLLREALGLADWIGERPVVNGRLTAADAQAAAQALALPAPRAGGDVVPEVERMWDALGEVGLIERDGAAVAQGKRPDIAVDEEVLRLWISLLDGLVGQEYAEGEALSPVEVVWSELPGVLLRLYEHGTPVAIGQLVTDLLEHIQAGYDVADGEVFAEGVPQALRLDLEDLARWGAVEFVTADEARLTPLGVFAVRELLLAEGYTAPLIGELAASTAADLVQGLAFHREDTAEEEVALWLARRSAEEAAQQLLTLMREGRPSQRNIAAVVLSQVDRPAEQLIRGALDFPETRPYALMWLTGQGHEDVAPSDADMQWMFVDTVAGMTEALGAHDAVHLALSDTPPDADLTGLISDIWRLPHPDVADVLEAIGDHHHDRELAKLARKSVFKARSK
ncbi:hypothetical protein LO762_17155 [Actinocorallia sp. API 0066]|uniref:hypothetical protein n=1 Tax=Actinocorallia sp. API 0066 TaxID=2896846 RepID=UPI001E50A647|nr:hypothetical protein [Actinocorallia sp. API 0066]MCD0450910.1 hypothetical protein [Actinocorallia sp. API 0066]